MFSDEINFVKIATDKMENGEAVFEQLKQGRSGGMPWIAILDGDGNEIVSSVGPNGNIGCPVNPPEIGYFIEMIEASTDASPDRIATIREALDAHALKIKGG